MEERFVALKKRKKSDGHVNAWLVLAVVLAFVVAVGILAKMQLDKYENGILEIYATQQDGYVQLVLDQINLQDDRAEEEIIQDILETLDTSNNRYWTLSEQDSIIFVKDVLETNRYKGFTTETYYASKSADAFIQKLSENKVTHAKIEMNDKVYVASGTKFSYNGGEYHLCLLTGRDSILDQNEYLSAKICLFLLGILVLAFLVIGGMILVILAEKWYRRYMSTERENRELVATVEKLNSELTKDMLFHPQYTAFHAKALPLLFQKMEEKDVWPLHMLLVRCPEGARRRMFFEEAQLLLDKRTIRVILNHEYLLLLCLRCEEMTSEERREQITQMGAQLAGWRLLEERPEEYLEAVFARLYKEVTGDGKQTVS